MNRNLKKYIPALLLAIAVASPVYSGGPGASSTSSEEEQKCTMLARLTSYTSETIRLSLRGKDIETILEFPGEYYVSPTGWQRGNIMGLMKAFNDPGLLNRLVGYERQILVYACLPDLIPETYSKRVLDPIYGKHTYTHNQDSYDITLINLSTNFSSSVSYRAKRTQEEMEKDHYQKSGEEQYGLYDMGFRLIQFDKGGEKGSEWIKENSRAYYWPTRKPDHIGFHIFCKESQTIPDTHCSANRDVTANFIAIYNFPIGYLADWKEIDNKVLDLISSWMVNQEDKDMLEAARIK